MLYPFKKCFYPVQFIFFTIKKFVIVLCRHFPVCAVKLVYHFVKGDFGEVIIVFLQQSVYGLFQFFLFFKEVQMKSGSKLGTSSLWPYLFDSFGIEYRRYNLFLILWRPVSAKIFPHLTSPCPDMICCQ